MQYRTRHIFIVEDNEVYSMMLDYILTKDNAYRLLSFKSGEECLNHLHLKPDLVVLDYDLPGMNGYDTMRKLKHQLPKTHVVILTRHDDSELAMKLLKAGADEYIAKNKDAEVKILERIEKIILAGEMKKNKSFFTRLTYLIVFGILLATGLFVAFSRSDSEMNIRPNEKAADITRDSAMSEGLAKKNAGDYVQAISFFNKALQYDPMSASAYLNRAYCKAKLLDYKSALQDYTHALLVSQSWEESFEAYYNRGLTQALLDNLREAMSDFDFAIKLNPEYADAYYNRSIARGKIGDFGGELEDINRVIALRPRDARAWNSRGVVKAITGDYRGAVSDYTEALALNKDYADAWFNRALMHSELNEYQKALSDFTRALRLSPDAETYNRRGNVRRKMNDFHGAFEDYTSAIQIDQEYYLAYLNRGYLKFDLKDYKSAMDDYTSAIQIKPDCSMAWYHRGLAKGMLNDRKGEIADYTKAILGKPDYQEAYYRRGLVKYQNGEQREGCFDLNKAVKLGSQEAYDFLIEKCK